MRTYCKSRPEDKSLSSGSATRLTLPERSSAPDTLDALGLVPLRLRLKTARAPGRAVLSRIAAGWLGLQARPDLYATVTPQINNEV